MRLAPREHSGGSSGCRVRAQTPKVEAALRELGGPGGLLDAADPAGGRAQGAHRRPLAERQQPNNPSHTAGRRSSASSSTTT
jgi:hypothetical protein